MAIKYSQTPKKVSLPPKRGQIKARIFGNLVKPVVSLASKAGEGMQLSKIGGRGRTGSSASSTSSTSSCASEETPSPNGNYNPDE